MNLIKSEIFNQNIKIVIIASRTNNFINQHLIEGATDILHRIGKIKLKQIKIIRTPGAYEIPLIAATLSSSKKYDAIIALGTIIKGETIHFKKIAFTVINSLLKISIKYIIPIASGIIIAETTNQAIERAGVKQGNKGSDAALCVLEMIDIINSLKNTHNN
ncbi:6,7-dimethyl-8-ribityllumazine synthase [Buchnera aphidicola (Thelaxes suberi)]|uniref:6,7-dimethyl-8-ribityllumazine synthase n=1 Tax=Buchnera aphidicola TaxID=9 RepID=UPI0034649B8E